VKLTQFRYDECGNFRVALQGKVGTSSITLERVVRNERAGERAAKRLAKRIVRLRVATAEPRLRWQ
jgi:hypothetical protein